MAPSAARGALSVTMLGALPPWRGVAPYTRHLIAGLEDLDELSVEFLDFKALYPRRLYPGGDPIDRNGTTVRFRSVAVRRFLAWYNPLSWLRAGLTARGQVVHAQWWSYVLAPVYLTVLGLARLRGKRIVLTLHNVAPHEGCRWQRWLYRNVFRLAQHFIVHTQQNAHTLMEAYPAAVGKITIVPIGLLTVPASRPMSAEDAREELGLMAGRLIVLAFGNIRPYKGVDVLLRAFRRMLDAGQQATLVIAGEPWGGFDVYSRLIDELDLGAHVQTRLEYLSEESVDTLFRAADLAVFPYTHFDAQSAAGTLALSFGVPMVVSDAGGLPDLVDDRRAVVPANDERALADVLVEILRDDSLRAKLAADAERRAGELSWDVIARKTADVYRSLI